MKWVLLFVPMAISSWILLFSCSLPLVEDAEITLGKSDWLKDIVWEVQAIDPYTVKIEWNSTSYTRPNSQIVLERKSLLDSKFVEIGQVGFEIGYFRDVDLSPDHNYSYRIKLNDQGVDTEFSLPKRIKTFPLVELGQFLILDTLFSGGSKGDKSYPSISLAYSLDTYESGKFSGGPVRFDIGTGRFRLVKIEDEWSFVDPEGYLFFGAGVNSVPAAEQFTSIKLPSDLRNLGFNHLANWSAFESINQVGPPMPYTSRVLFLAGYKNLEVRTKELYAKGVIPIFDQAFYNYADQMAKLVEEDFSRDPYCIGIFSDNELPLYSNERYGDLLERFLNIEDKEDPNFKAAREWLFQRNGTYEVSSITSTDRYDWHGYLASTYYSIVHQALKRHAPDVLYLGSRLHGAAKNYANIFKESAPYVDVFSINFYGPHQPEFDQISLWENGTDKPFMITEFYAKGFDVELDNSGGAGFHVPSQKDRALYYENFVMRLISRKNCVGYQWFRFQDDSSNKGLVNKEETWYQPLTTSVKKINSDLYNLRKFLLYDYVF
ncbi:MAG: hypothetical protein RJA52_1397 [Bacteroidota bacterium]|jgi:hypothetical protein